MVRDSRMMEIFGCINQTTTAVYIILWKDNLWFNIKREAIHLSWSPELHHSHSKSGVARQSQPQDVTSPFLKHPWEKIILLYSFHHFLLPMRCVHFRIYFQSFKSIYIYSLFSTKIMDFRKQFLCSI